MDRSFTDVILHSSPVALLLLLAAGACTAVFVYRVCTVQPPKTGAHSALTDAILFASVLAFIGILLSINLAQAIYGLVIEGVDSDRALVFAVENVFYYGCLGAVQIAVMTVSQLVRAK